MGKLGDLGRGSDLYKGINGYYHGSDLRVNFWVWVYGLICLDLSTLLVLVGRG